MLRQLKKSRQRKKKSPQAKKVVPANKVAPEKKSRAKGKKVFARMKEGYIPSTKLYARMYGTNRAPYISDHVMILLRILAFK